MFCGFANKITSRVRRGLLPFAKYLASILPLSISRVTLLRSYIQRYKTSDILKKSFDTFLSPEDRSNTHKLDGLTADMALCSFLYGANPTEYFLWDFPNKPRNVRKTFLTNHLRAQFTYAGDNWRRLEDKYNFYIFAKPFFKRNAVLVESQNDKGAFLELAHHADRLFAKPLDLYCGIGATLLNTKTEEEAINAFELLMEKQGKWIVEECIVQTAEMASWNPDSVNTVRIPSYFINGKSIIMGAVLRTGRAGSIVDNGGAGGCFACIDSETGIITTDACSEYGKSYSQHPDSGKVYKGYQIPDWQSIQQLTQTLHHLLSDIRYISFDFAHTEYGWVLVEANANGECLSQFVEKIGQKEKFLHYMLHP